MKLLIVESPTKTKSLSGYLGKGYRVVATMGHIRDLPRSKMGVAIKLKKKSVKGKGKDKLQSPSNKIQTDLNNQITRDKQQEEGKGKSEKEELKTYVFKPEYIQVRGKAKQVNEIRDMVKKADEVFLATDPDREGEAIAWHVLELMKEKGEDGGKFSRVVFHSITKEAVLEAMKSPGKINRSLVEAQQARRVLDKIVGFRLSPVLWKKVRRGLSAGRVQSVAVRLVLEREEEIEAFKPTEYWKIWADLLTKDRELLTAELKQEVNDEKQAKKIKSDLQGCTLKVGRVVKRTRKVHPKPPFKTSTMQQAAASVYGWSARKTMSVAQSLYEHGSITYHRTDSLSLAPGMVDGVRSLVKVRFGKDYVPEKLRVYRSSGKVSAQEAHEAIRPTEVGLVPEEFAGKGKMAMDEKKLYKLVWQRTIASQMASGVYDRTRVEVEAGKYLLLARGEVEKFDGWRVVYKKQEINSKIQTKNKLQETNQLPRVEEGERLDLKKVVAEQKFTQPPARYNDASLIRELEKRGIGRPSTYAPTITKIIQRRYVERKEKRFFITDIGRMVGKFLIKNFPEQLDYEFTARMEEELDEVALRKKDWQEMLSLFYGPFNKKVLEVEEKVKAVVIPVVKTGRKCPKCKKGEIIVKTGRFGEFLACDQFPECRHIENLTKYLEGVVCEKCGAKVVIKKTKRGREFYGCEKYPKCDWASWKKPIVGKEKK